MVPEPNREHEEPKRRRRTGRARERDSSETRGSEQRTAAEARCNAASTAAQAPQMRPQLHTRAPTVICQYSDGAWEPPEPGSKDAPEPAGYGVVELECRSERHAHMMTTVTAQSQGSCEEAYFPLRQLGERRRRDRREGRVTWALSGR